MNILIKLLYLLQNIHLPPPKHFFIRLNKLLTNFIWNNRWPRLWLSLLYLIYDRGGLQCPNVCIIGLLWSESLCSTFPPNILGQHEISCSYIWSAIKPVLIFCWSQRPQEKKCINLLVLNMINVWYVVKRFGIPNNLSCYSHICGNTKLQARTAWCRLKNLGKIMDQVHSRFILFEQAHVLWGHS